MSLATNSVRFENLAESPQNNLTKSSSGDSEVNYMVYNPGSNPEWELIYY